MLACVDPNACITRLNSGETLNVGEKICNGDYILQLQADGNLIITSSSTGQITWSSNTSGSGAVKLVMQADGNLVLLDSNNVKVWSIEKYSSLVPGSNAMMTSDGSFVVFSGTTSSWSTSMVRCPDTIRSGQVLEIGESRTSCNGDYSVTMQADGNFVVTSSTGQTLWSTNTAGSGAIKAIMQEDGNFVLVDSNSNVVWQLSTYATIVPGTSAKISDNGEFMTYAGSQINFVGRVRQQYGCGKIF